MSNIFLDRACAARDGVHVTTISVDIVISRSKGDLAQESVQGFWIRALRQGAVIGMLCGPPCNTWSRARGQDYTDSSGQVHHGPRIVRTILDAWGLPSLSLRELDDVNVGHVLLHFSLWAFLELTIIGGSALMEHPADLDPQQVSIWKLPSAAFLRKLPGVRFHEIQQGAFGSASAKPTGLLAANLPALEHCLASWTLTTEKSFQDSSIGVSAQGQFLTAPLKEYAPSLCAAMADAFYHALSLPEVMHDFEPPLDFQQRCKDMTATRRGAVIGADISK